jgi:hypothetical protein
MSFVARNGRWECHCVGPGSQILAARSVNYSGHSICSRLVSRVTLLVYWANASTLKVMALCFSKTSVIYRTARCHFPGDSIFHSYRHDNIKMIFHWMFDVPIGKGSNDRNG